MLAADTVDVSALQLLNIMVYLFRKHLSMAVWSCYFLFFEDNNELYDAVVCCAFFAALQTDTNGWTMVPYADRDAAAFFCLYQPAF